MVGGVKGAEWLVGLLLQCGGLREIEGAEWGCDSSFNVVGWVGLSEGGTPHSMWWV